MAGRVSDHGTDDSERQVVVAKGHGNKRRGKQAIGSGFPGDRGQGGG